MSETSVAVPESTPTATQTYILFGVAGTTYAIKSQQVLHIEMIEHVTPVPNAPAFVEGVVFSRGQVVPVINLRARFGFERGAITLRSRLLVVQHETRRVGLLADESREFIRISDTAIRPPQEAIGGLSGNYLEGVASLGARIVLVLNVRELVETVPTALS
ncbi:MAG TPA: chemotaxis protein CheW [Vicinamibacterales bacterium]|jgi:chemotaxis signal transduction protein|nr:chemotaxis protein CheW [Vicinamibacterales bacterium]